MRFLKPVSLCLLISGAFTLCAQNHVSHFPKKDSLALVRDIERINSEYSKSFANADSTAFLNSYSNDAAIMPPGVPMLSGKTRMLRFFKFALTSGVRGISFSMKGLYGLTAEFVTEQGQYEMFDGNQKSIGKGKFLVVWKKTESGWKMFRDMFSDDAASGLGAKK